MTLEEYALENAKLQLEVARLQKIILDAVPIWSVAPIGADTELGQKYLCITPNEKEK